MFFKHIASIQKVLKFKSDVINTHIKCRNTYAETCLLGLLSSLFSKSGKPLLYIVFQLRMFSFFKTDVLQKQILLHKHFLFSPHPQPLVLLNSDSHLCTKQIRAYTIHKNRMWSWACICFQVIGTHIRAD